MAHETIRCKAPFMGRVYHATVVHTGLDDISIRFETRERMTLLRHIFRMKPKRQPVARILLHASGPCTIYSQTLTVS